MNKLELEVAILRGGLSAPKLAEKIGISKKTIYTKMRGDSVFNQKEILKIKEVLALNDTQILNIFFDEKVS